ncbi:MAG: hypothetical protein RSD95_14030 [Clostridia bacterium]
MEGKESQRVDVTIQQAQVEEADELSLSDVWGALKRSRIKLLAWLLVCVFAGSAIGAGYALLKQEKLVSTIVQFSYDGVEKGQDPKGAMLDVNIFKSPQIIGPVLSQLGYVNSKEVNAETVRQAVMIEGQVPQDVIDRLTVVTTIATDAASVTNLEKVLDVSYYPTQYKVSLDAGALDLSDQAAQALLDGMMKSYGTYFYDTYANVQMMGAAVKGTDYLDYDYTEALDVLNAQIATMTSYINGLEARGGGFRSVATGYTFADINASLAIIRSIDVTMVDAQVYSYNLTKDKALLMTYLNYQLEDLMHQLGVARQALTSINEKLDAYEKDTVLMMGGDAQQSAEASMSLTLASTEYDGLIEQSIGASARVAQLQAEINKLQARIQLSQREQGTPAVSLSEYNRRCDEVEQRLARIAKKLGEWVGVVEQTAQEYFETEEFNDAFKVLVPAQTGQKARIMSIIKYALVGMAGACGAMLLLYVAGVCFSLVTGKRQCEIPQSKGTMSA